MIRRSEKRSLIGLEALERQTRVLNPNRQAAAEALSIALEILRLVPGPETVSMGEFCVIPLVNRF
jgi:hypothetical protein